MKVEIKITDDAGNIRQTRVSGALAFTVKF